MKNEIKFKGPFAIYCDFDCIYLSVTEAKQIELKNTLPHICRQFNQEVFHNFEEQNAYPNIFRCGKCLDFEEHYKIGV